MMDPADKKAFERTLAKIWPLEEINPMYWIILRKGMEAVWEGAKEHYENEYSIPKPEGRL